MVQAADGAFKHHDKWAKGIARATGRMLPGLIALQQMGALFENMAEGMISLEIEGDYSDAEGYKDDPVPVIINTPSTATKVTGKETDTKIERLMEITLNPAEGQVLPMPIVNLGGAIRSYPMSQPISIPTPFPIHVWGTDWAPPARIPEVRLDLTITGASSFVLAMSVAKDLGKVDFAENRLREPEEKKPLAGQVYLAGTRFLAKSWGTVSEVLDIQEAIMANTRVRVGGFWYDLNAVNHRHGS